MDDAVPLQQAERRNGSVKIQAGRKSGTEREAESLQRVHIYMVTVTENCGGA
jgi:hypothetical protein